MIQLFRQCSTFLRALPFRQCSTFSRLTPVRYFPVMLVGISGHCKAKYMSMHGTSDNLFDSYLQEYMLKKQHKDNIFRNILYWISFILAHEVS